MEAPARMLALHRVRDPAADIEPGYRGIPEPREHLPRVDLRPDERGQFAGTGDQPDIEGFPGGARDNQGAPSGSAP
mgnify:CR=1 FL=1